MQHKRAAIQVSRMRAAHLVGDKAQPETKRVSQYANRSLRVNHLVSAVDTNGSQGRIFASALRACYRFKLMGFDDHLAPHKRICL
jgi:hypothetical protein